MPGHRPEVLLQLSRAEPHYGTTTTGCSQCLTAKMEEEPEKKRLTGVLWWLQHITQNRLMMAMPFVLAVKGVGRESTYRLKRPPKTRRLQEGRAACIAIVQNGEGIDRSARPAPRWQ